MELIEHKYLPQDLSELIAPNKTELLNQIHEHIKNQTMNLLLIGKSTTFKTRVIKKNATHFIDKATANHLLEEAPVNAEAVQGIDKNMRLSCTGKFPVLKGKITHPDYFFCCSV